MRCKAREIEHLESSIRQLETENCQLKEELANSEQVATLKGKIEQLDNANCSLRKEEQRLVQEMKNYKQKSYIGVNIINIKKNYLENNNEYIITNNLHNEKDLCR